MKHGHTTGTKREKPGTTPQFDAIQAAHLARIETEEAARQTTTPEKTPMQYRRTAAAIYRHYGTTTDVLTPWGWIGTTFMLGASGWDLLILLSEPIDKNPAWPA